MGQASTNFLNIKQQYKIYSIRKSGANFAEHSRITHQGRQGPKQLRLVSSLIHSILLSTLAHSSDTYYTPDLTCERTLMWARLRLTKSANKGIHCPRKQHMMLLVHPRTITSPAPNLAGNLRHKLRQRQGNHEPTSLCLPTRPGSNINLHW